jgi:zona occludens toxin (predicted ATPase)
MKKSNKVFKFLFAMVLGMLISAFSMGSYTAHAEAQQAASAELDQEQAEADNAGSGAFLIMGGMLLIILAVVITVVASFVVTAPIVDEI